MAADSVFELVSRISRLLQAEVRTSGLPAAQLEALAYLASANRYSDTPAAVAEYFGTSRGTTSQTLLALERAGLLNRSRDAQDGRVVHLEPTSEGRRLVRKMVPPPVLRRAVAKMGPRRGHALDGALRGLLLELVQANEGRAFGVCRTCGHFRREPQGRFRCGLTQEPLSEADSNLLCREHVDEG